MTVIAGLQEFPVPAIPLRRVQMNLPQELLDEILSYLPLEDVQGQPLLASCSLVSKSWTNPSRRHLFKAVNISEKFLPSWLDRISPTNHQLLHHIQALSYITSTQTWRNGEPPKYFIDVLKDYLPSFHQLQHLSLFSMQIPSDISLKLEMFSAFRSTLSRLSLKHCDVTISALVTLINYFPNLDHLDLSSLRHSTDGEPTPPLYRPQMSRLHLSELRMDALGILNQLSELGPAFDEVQLTNNRPPARLPALTRIANTVGEKAKRLRLLRTSRVCMCTRARTHREPDNAGHRSPGRMVHTALSLPRAPGVRNGRDASWR